MTKLSATVTVRGPLFSKGGAPVRRASERAVKDLVEMGDQRLNQVLRRRPGGVFLSVAEAQKGKASTGHYRRNIQSRLRGLIGVITDGGVIYGPWLEGVSSKNRTTRFKGYGSFRKTTTWLQRQARGVLQRRIRQAVRELS